VTHLSHNLSLSHPAPTVSQNPLELLQVESIQQWSVSTVTNPFALQLKFKLFLLRIQLLLAFKFSSIQFFLFLSLCSIQL